MTSVLDDNVFNIAADGTFDDCQRVMKNIFRNAEFKRQYALGAVNSVNWARVLAQIVYYFYAGLRVMKSESCECVSFSVPTGNFGDILAGYYAARMGLPVERLILATNENDILSRFFNTGVYALGTVVPTLRPSMDIPVASNFERYLYYRTGENPARIRATMNEFEHTGRLSVEHTGERIDPLFAAGSANTPQTLDVIRSFYNNHGYLLDPHTATGVHVARELKHNETPVICLATAHPAKFGKAIAEALGRDLAHHPLLDSLADVPTRCARLPANEAVIQNYIRQNA